MSNEMVVRHADLPMSTEQVREHVNAIQKIMEAVMKKDVHYGVIPGTRKPSLWKPGAEVLGTTFRIAPSFQIEDLSGPKFYRYRVRCIGPHQGTEIVLGEGMGACSSNEEKYKWRKILSPTEWDAAPDDSRRLKYGYDRDSRKSYEIKQVRAEADDVDNTILKMACKRAQIAMIINVTAAGDIFAQDIEDLPEHLRDEEVPTTPAKPVEQPKVKPKTASPPPAAPPAEASPQSGKAEGAAPSQGASEVIRSHKPEVGGSTPPSATIEGEATVVEDEAPPTEFKPLIEGQKRILRARCKSAGKELADLEAQFGPLDQIAFDKFSEAQAWAMA